MSKYIKLEDAIDAICGSVIVTDKASAEEVANLLSGIKKRLADLPTIEVSEDCISRPRGEWIGISYDGYADGYPVYDEWECSNCGYETEEETRYCPNCGADMRGESE